jgi:hypothetical protein
MAREEESFETLVKEAPLAPAAETVSLVGTLARSSEAGKFVLTLQDGRAVTLETAAVKGYMVLGTSLGQLPPPDHIHTALSIDHPGTGGPRLD